MPIVRRSRRLSNQTLPDPLDQYVPGGFDYLDIPYAATEPLVGHPVVATGNYNAPISLQTIQHLCAFANQRELPPPDLHSQCRRRKGKNGNAPRPPNAFMLFRSDFWRFNKATIPERDHRQISRIAAHCWNALEEPRRVPYQDQARKLKDEHAQLYPQHKYNLTAKEKAAKKVKKEETDNDELCGVIAARVAQGVRDLKPPKISGSSEGGLLDQIVEQKVNLKRPRSASFAAAVERGVQAVSQPPVKKRKKNAYKPSIPAIPVPVVESQDDSSHSPSLSFVPTNEIPILTLPRSQGSPVVKTESLQDQVLEVVTQIVAAKKEPTLSLPIVSPKTESPELEVPKLPASVSPQFPSFGYEFPVQWYPLSADTVVDRGLKISEDYGLSGPTEGLDFSAFGYSDDTSAMPGLTNGGDEFDEFAEWFRIPY